MEKGKSYQNMAIRMLKSLLSAYIITGILLLFLALLLYKFQLSEPKVNIGIIIVYVISSFLGGFLEGKMMKARKFLWGAAAGLLFCYTCSDFPCRKPGLRRRVLPLCHHTHSVHSRRHPWRYGVLILAFLMKILYSKKDTLSLPQPGTAQNKAAPPAGTSYKGVNFSWIRVTPYNWPYYCCC